MLHGTLWDKIPRFAIPVAATAILSQLFNAADIAVIGNFTGEPALWRSRPSAQTARSSA